MLSAEQKLAIKAFIETDPDSLGFFIQTYDTAKPFSQASGNAKRATLDNVEQIINQALNYPVSRGSVQQAEIIAAAGDVSSLTTEQVTKYNTLLLMQSVDMSDSNNQLLVDAAFPAAQYGTQNAALKALASRSNGSAAENLVGRNLTRKEISDILFGGEG